MVFMLGESSPFMAQQFRLVNYWDLPRIAEDAHVSFCSTIVVYTTFAGFCRSFLQTTLAGSFGPSNSVQGFVSNHRFGMMAYCVDGL